MVAFSDLDSITSSGDTDEETYDATESYPADIADPDVTVNDHYIGTDSQEPHHSNSNSRIRHGIMQNVTTLHYCFTVGHIERVICVVGKLLELAGKKCRTANCLSACSLTHNFSGCTLIIKGICQQGHHFQWTSSPAIDNKCGSTIHEDNMLFSMAVVLSGNNYQKIESFSKTLSLHVISRSTFHMYQRLYICPGIEKFYFKTQVNRNYW